MDQKSEAQIQNYTLITKIGQGSAAQVMLAKENLTKTLCVLKTIEKTGYLHDEEKLRLLQQKNAFIELTHPFLVQIHQAFQTRNHFIFALEYCAGGDLYTHLHMSEAFSEEKIAFYGAQLVLAIEYMHSKNVIHQDIKPENILIAKDGYLKLTDFGMSQSDVISDHFKIHSVCGTTEYIAPEMILEQGHGKAYDWWTLGCTLYEMLYKISPFYSDCREQMNDKILNSEPSFQKGVNGQLKEIIIGLLNKNSQERLAFAKNLKTKSFFAKMNFQKLLKKQYPASYMMENSKGKKMLKVDKAEVSKFTRFENKYSSCCYLELFDCFDVAQLKEETVSTISSIKKSRKMSTDASESDSQLSEKSDMMISSLKNCALPIKLY